MINRISRFIEKDKETTMKLEFAFLCDYVDFTGRGLFNAYGAGIHALHCRKLPDARPIALMMAIEYDPAEDSGKHTIEIRIIDPDGRNVIKPNIAGADFPGTVRFYGFDTKLYPTFEKYGAYSAEVRLDGNTIVSIPLDIIMDK